MSIELGLAAAAEGMNRVEAGANEQWKHDMAIAIENVARREPGFNADDCFEELATFSDATTRDNRAFGPAITRAAKAGICQKTPTFVPSRRAELHATPIRMWESLIYEPR